MAGPPAIQRVHNASVTLDLTGREGANSNDFTPMRLIDIQGTIIDAGGTPTPVAEVLAPSKPRAFLPIHHKLIKSATWWKWDRKNNHAKDDFDNDLFTAVVEEENKDTKRMTIQRGGHPIKTCLQLPLCHSWDSCTT